MMNAKLNLLILNNGWLNVLNVGILAQDASSFKNIIKNGDSYIATSYIKYVEAAGGRVIPIR